MSYAEKNTSATTTERWASHTRRSDRNREQWYGKMDSTATTQAQMTQIQPKIVSGGQTGVDRAALDFALELGTPCGGWCPRGRQAEDGRIPDRYPLDELAGGYKVRTERNVRDSDATLILIADELAGGTLLTRNFCRKHGKPHIVVKLTSSNALGRTRRWIDTTEIEVLNVAGPRESSEPGIYENTNAFLRSLFNRGR